MTEQPAPPRSIDAVLEALRRGHRQLARNPKVALHRAVRQMLALGASRAPGRPGESARTYRIDDLARVSGVTVRNIRAYLERGLLHPPQRHGRTSVFDDTHLARLRIIASMLDRGYTSANIREMLLAWERGADLGEVLGLERALVVQPAGDEPVGTTREEARRLAGGREDFDLLVGAGLIEVSGSRTRVLRPRLLEAFAEMRSHGMTTSEVLGIHQAVVPSIDRISSILVAAGAGNLGDRFMTADPLSDAEVGDLVATLTRFRTLAMASVTESLAASIEGTIETLLTDYLAQTVLAQTVPADQPGEAPTG